jgi:hypothetical protein
MRGSQSETMFEVFLPLEFRFSLLDNLFVLINNMSKILCVGRTNLHEIPGVFSLKIR